MARHPLRAAVLVAAVGADLVGDAMTPLTDAELDGLQERLRISVMGIGPYSTIDIEAAIRSLRTERDALRKELDFASPKELCARCGKEFRWYQMVPEEGDEWECFECNERENAREKAAMQGEQQK